MKSIIKALIVIVISFCFFSSKAQNKIKSDEDLKKAIGWILSQKNYFEELESGNTVFKVSIFIDSENYDFGFKKRQGRLRYEGEFNLTDVIQIALEGKGFENNYRNLFIKISNEYTYRSFLDDKPVENFVFSRSAYSLPILDKDGMPERMKKAFEDITSYLRNKKYGDSENMY